MHFFTIWTNNNLKGLENQIRLGSPRHKKFRQRVASPARMHALLGKFFKNSVPCRNAISALCLSVLEILQPTLSLFSLALYSIIVMPMCDRDKVVTGMVCVPNNYLYFSKDTITFLSLSGGSVSTGKPIIRKLLL